MECELKFIAYTAAAYYHTLVHVNSFNLAIKIQGRLRMTIKEESFNSFCVSLQ